MVFDLPLIRRRGVLLFSPMVVASGHRIRVFFYDTLEPIAIVLAVAVFAALLIEAVLRTKPSTRENEEPVYFEEKMLLAAFLVEPILLNLVLMHGHRAFSDRYSITAQLAIYFGVVGLIGMLFRWRPACAAVASCVLVLFITSYRIMPKVLNRPPKNVIAFGSVRPDLALVPDSGATFLEMNHYESPATLQRLYFLKDRASAVKYSHSTEAEDYLPPDQLGPTFSIRSAVEPYAAFTQQHSQFLVFSLHRNPESWLIPKLRDDHARIVSLGEYAAPGSYRDSTLYLVTMRGK